MNLKMPPTRDQIFYSLTFKQTGEKIGWSHTFMKSSTTQTTMYLHFRLRKGQTTYNFNVKISDQWIKYQLRYHKIVNKYGYFYVFDLFEYICYHA